MELTDWELVQKCQSGEMSAFQELVSRYHQKVYMVILGLLRHREDALEVAQETFFRAFRKINSFQGGSSFYTWLYRIAVNMAIDAQRRQKRNPLRFGVERLTRAAPRADQASTPNNPKNLAPLTVEC